MIYPVIILLAVICTTVTLFLIKESFTSTRKKLFTFITLIATCITVISAISTVLYSFKESEYALENNIYKLQMEIDKLETQLNVAQNQIYQYQNDNNTTIDNSNETANQVYNQPILFDNVPCFVLSKNYNDTELSNDGTEFTFYNHPEEADNYNTITFSFNLEKYSFFSSRISINDNINHGEKVQTTIGFYNEKDEAIYIEKFDNNTFPSYIYIDVSNMSTLTITISTNMVNTKDDIFRTVSFSDIIIENAYSNNSL